MNGFGVIYLRSRFQQLRLRSSLRKVRLVVCDVDGVLTDGGLYYDVNGGVTKRFDVRDGLAVRMLQRAGITVALLSGGRSGSINHRALHLDITHCLVSVDDKCTALESLRAEVGMSKIQTAFIGDDLNDLPVRTQCGLLIAPSDAVPALRCHADWVLRHRGGEGAFRELSDALLASHGKLEFFKRQGLCSSN